MWKVAALLTALIAATIPLSFLSGDLASGLSGAMSAGCLLIAIATIRPGERSFLKLVTATFLSLGLIFLLWILIQMLPLPWFANAVWKTAQDILDRPAAGSISVDLGITLEACLNYLTWLSTCILAAAVAIDPRRAYQVVYAAIAAATVLAVIGTVPNIAPPDWAAGLGTAVSIAAALTVNPLCVANAFEAFETSQRKSAGSSQPWGRCLGFAAAGLAGWCAIYASAGVRALVPLAAGALIVILVWAARSLRMRVWSSVGVILTLAAIAIGIAIASPLHTGVPIELAFSVAPDATIAATQSVLADLPFAGIGAGTSGEMLRTYQELQNASSFPAAASSAAATAIGLGKPALWVILAAALLGSAIFFKGSIQRGRHWSFAASAAGALVSISIASFEFPNLISVPSTILLAVIIGLGLAQRIGRTRT